MSVCTHNWFKLTIRNKVDNWGIVQCENGDEVIEATTGKEYLKLMWF